MDEQMSINEVNEIFEQHKKAFREWKEGDIAIYWFDTKKNLCIKYESGKMWHYRYTPNGLEWW